MARRALAGLRRLPGGARVHGITSAKDLRSGGLLTLTAACVPGVAAAICYRLASTWAARRRTNRAAGLLIADRRQDSCQTAAPRYSPPAPATTRTREGAAR